MLTLPRRSRRVYLYPYMYESLQVTYPLHPLMNPMKSSICLPPAEKFKPSE